MITSALISGPDSARFIPVDSLGREKWLELRKQGLGGTDLAAITGASPYSSAYQVYMDKFWDKEKEVTAAMEEGNIWEPLLLSEYQRRRDDIRVHPGVFVRHRKHDCIFASLDGLVLLLEGTPAGIVECKKVGEWTKKDWGEEGSEQVPPAYYVQTQIQLEVADLEWCDIIVKMPNKTLADCPIFTITRDREFGANLVRLGVKTWNDWKAGNAPTPDGSKEAQEFLKYKYPYDLEAPKQADGLITLDCQRLGEVRGELAKLEAEENELKNRIMEYMGESPVLTFEGGKITWKNVKDSTVIDFKKIVAELDPPQDLIDKYTTVKPGVRRFTPTFDKVKE